MNISSEISSIFPNSSDFLSNGTEAQIDFVSVTVIYIISILLRLLINSYVIWLIVRGTGNGLAAEIFILNFSICEILMCLGFLLNYIALYFQISWITFFDGLTSTGRPLFESLICVERYLAVVHPVTFLKFKPLRYRLMCSAVAWVTCFVFCILILILLCFSLSLLHFISCWALFIVFFSIQLFCCVAVLRALKQSGPGERGREREEENHMKRRAFHLILITTVTTAIIYVPYIVLCLATAFKWNSMEMYLIPILFTLAGLVQPVLFFNRVRKLNLIKCQ